MDLVIGDSAKTSLSVGQMQRICLARGLVRKPKVLLLDEVTSALDAETEASIVRTFENLRDNGMTIISVTHGLSNTLNADKIIVLDDGTASTHFTCTVLHLS